MVLQGDESSYFPVVLLFMKVVQKQVNFSGLTSMNQRLSLTFQLVRVPPFRAYLTFPRWITRERPLQDCNFGRLGELYLETLLKFKQFEHDDAEKHKL